MEQEEVLVEGWCSNCICKVHYHLGDNNGICMECKCQELAADDDSDILDRLKGFLYKSFYEHEQEYKILGESGVTEEDFGEEGSPVSNKILREEEIFIGKASRECKECGDVKLYKSFNDSHDPKVLCNYCAWEAAQDEQQQQQIDEMEDRIIANELAHEEAQERQEMIDECLRALDE